MSRRLELSWRELPNLLRKNLEFSLLPASARRLSTSDLDDEFTRVELNASNIIIAVPFRVFDSDHRKRLIKECSSFIPKAMADARWTKASGRLLGSKRKWRSFLLVEDWQRLGVAKEHAINLTAFSIYSGTDYGGTAEQRLSNAQDHTRKRHKRFSKVNGDVHAIEACIASVYPRFYPTTAG